MSACAQRFNNCPNIFFFMNRNLVIEPLHHSVMHALQSVHPSLGDTIRLLCRWLSGHMLSGSSFVLLNVVCVCILAND